MNVLEAPLAVKEAALRARLRSFERCVVAFSGGVDSALVAAVATSELGTNALAVTGVSPSLPGRERRAAETFAAALGVRHELLATDELEDQRYASNPANRCYYCKTELYERLVPFANARGYTTIADGLNADDLAEIRPGRRAAEERGVRSPLAEAGFTKIDVRALARRLGLDVADKPAAACLASRFPTGTAITADLLGRVEAAEDVLVAHGVDGARVRHHGDVARVEVPSDAFAGVLARRSAIVAGLRAAGYRCVTLDLAGYVRGGVAAATAEPGTIDLIVAR